MQGVKKARDLIRQNYSHEWFIDGLPAATTMIDTNSKSKYYHLGFPVGYVEDNRYYLYNHVMLVVRFHREKEEVSIVGVEAYPRTVKKLDYCPGANTDHEPLELIDLQQLQTLAVPYTYAVYWREEKDVNYAHRWEQYVDKSETNTVHYLLLVYSSICVVIFSVLIAALVFGTLKNDINKETATGTGWRKLRSAVSAPPKAGVLLAVLVGAGFQLLVTCVSVITLFAFRIFDSNVPGRSLSNAIFLFVLSGTVAGYTSVHVALRRLPRSRRRSSVRQGIEVYADPDWFHVSFLLGAVMPGFVIFTVLFLNFFIWAKESLTALPFGTIMVLIVFYFFCEIPLALVGGYIANLGCVSRMKELESLLPAPVTLPINSPDLDNFHRELNSIDSARERIIPPQPLYLRPFWRSLVFGLAPFVCIYIELLYIYKSIWLHKNTFYYLYGFLLVTIILLVILVMESVIVAIYLLLNSGDHRWQWNSFAIGGAMAQYVLMYSVFYYMKHLYLQYDFVLALLYFAYSFLIYLLILLSLGGIGVTTGYFFVKKIYTVKKVD